MKSVARALSSPDNNRLQPEDRPAHDWYRFVLSFPPHLVREYLTKFRVSSSDRVLDPFCGTGTTLVECKRLGITSVGIEGNPLASFAASVKVDWTPAPSDFIDCAVQIADAAARTLDNEGVPDTAIFAHENVGKLRTLAKEESELLLKGSISERPLHKVLVLRELIERAPHAYSRHYKIALAKVVVSQASNLKFGPEVGVGRAKDDAAVIQPWLTLVRQMAADLEVLRDMREVGAEVRWGDARDAGMLLEPRSVDAVFTSPPYPNEKDYTRTTRLESVILGFLRTKQDLRVLKGSLVRSNTRGVYKADDDDTLVADYPEIQRIAEEIERRRVALGKTSGFERLYPRVTKLYFGGMLRHLEGLKRVLKPGARLGYVVGDQASYLRVMIRTGEILADIASKLGYTVDGIDLFRTRIATATKEQLREEVVLLTWPGQ